MAINYDVMRPMITAFSHTPVNICINAVSDDMPREKPVGYTITFDLITARFRISGECELREYPLTPEQIQAKLIEALKEDFKEASEHIEPIIK